MAKHDLDSMLHGPKLTRLYKSAEESLAVEIDDGDIDDSLDEIEIEDSELVYESLAKTGDSALDELESWDLDEIDDLIPNQFDY